MVVVGATVVVGRTVVVVVGATVVVGRTVVVVVGATVVVGRTVVVVVGATVVVGRTVVVVVGATVVVGAAVVVGATVVVGRTVVVVVGATVVVVGSTWVTRPAGYLTVCGAILTVCGAIDVVGDQRRPGAVHEQPAVGVELGIAPAAGRRDERHQTGQRRRRHLAGVAVAPDDARSRRFPVAVAVWCRGQSDEGASTVAVAHSGPVGVGVAEAVHPPGATEQPVALVVRGGHDLAERSQSAGSFAVEDGVPIGVDVAGGVEEQVTLARGAGGHPHGGGHGHGRGGYGRCRTPPPCRWR